MNTVKIGTEGSIFGNIEKGIESLKKIEKTGYDSIWMADHIMSWTPESIWTPDLVQMAIYQDNPHLYYDVFSMLALAAWNTENVMLGTSVTETFRRHPAILAQKFLTLDQISKGRMIMGIGAGEGENIIPYGIQFEKPVSRLEESLEIIKLLWESKEKVNYEGKFWTLKDAILTIPPYKKNQYPPIWIAAHGPKMLELTGKYGDGWLPAYSDPKAYKKRLDHIQRAAKKHERDPDEITPGLFTYLVVDEEHNVCDELIATPYVKNMLLTFPNSVFAEYDMTHPLGEDFYGLLDYIPTKFEKSTIMEAISKIPHKICNDTILHGTPDEIIGKIEEYAKVGLEHIVLTNITFMSDISKVKSSFNGMKKVLEYFKS